MDNHKEVLDALWCEHLKLLATHYDLNGNKLLATHLRWAVDRIQTLEAQVDELTDTQPPVQFSDNVIKFPRSR